MGWQPIREDQLREELERARARMTTDQQRFWDAIRIVPEKWQQNPWGNLGGGFWAVALIGQTVVWFNDVEEGFNTSRYTRYGFIDEYWCNQDELEWTVRNLLEESLNGQGSAESSG